MKRTRPFQEHEQSPARDDDLALLDLPAEMHQEVLAHLSMWDLLKGAAKTCRALHEASGQALVRRVDTHVLDRMDLSAFDGWSLADISMYVLLGLTPQPMPNRWNVADVDFEQSVIPWRTPEMRQKLTPKAARRFFTKVLNAICTKVSYFMLHVLKEAEGAFSLCLVGGGGVLFELGRQDKDDFDDVYLWVSNGLPRRHRDAIEAGLRAVRSLAAGSFGHANTVDFDSDSEGKQLFYEYEEAWDDLHTALRTAIKYFFLGEENWDLAVRAETAEGKFVQSLATGLIKQKQA
jgi:hypothetical protein